MVDLSFPARTGGMPEDSTLSTADIVMDRSPTAQEGLPLRSSISNSLVQAPRAFVSRPNERRRWDDGSPAKARVHLVSRAHILDAVSSFPSWLLCGTRPRAS
jgi:hypothetical protein